MADNETFVLVDEEYGFREYLWIYPGTPEDIMKLWREDNRFLTIHPNAYGKAWGGTVAEARNTFDSDMFRKAEESGLFTVMHVHNFTDSYLQLPGQEEEDHPRHGEGARVEVAFIEAGGDMEHARIMRDHYGIPQDEDLSSFITR